MKKRLLSLLLVLSLLLSAQLLLATLLATAEDDFDPRLYRSPDMRGVSGVKLVELIDYEMRKLYPQQVKESFYIDRAPKIGTIRYDWLVNDLNLYAQKYNLPFLRSPVVYDPDDRDRAGLNSGAPPDAARDSIGTITRSYNGKGSLNVPVWGKDYYGKWYIDWGHPAAYWFEHGWNGYRINGNFWNDSKSRKNITYAEGLDTLKRNRDSRYALYMDSRFINMKNIPGFPDGFLDDLIQYGVDEIWGGVQGRDVDFRNTGNYSARSQGFVHKRGERPRVYGTDRFIPWHDYVLVMIPPTYMAWGYGVRFITDAGNANIIYTMEVPIAPINMLLNDIKVEFVNPPSSAKPGDAVSVTARVSSFFADDVMIGYRWSVPEGAAVEYQNGQAAGEVAVPKMGSANVRAIFTMPEEGLYIKIEANTGGAANGAIVENGDYDNNTAEHFIAPGTVAAPQADNIPPWALTQDVAFSLTSTASLTLPRGSWDGNATGGLDIANESDIYSNFKVTNNPAVNEASAAITRRPNIGATLDRADFGDDPKNGRFAENSFPLVETALVTGSGSVSRNYTYTSRYTDPTGVVHSTTNNDTAYADFTDIDDRRTYAFDVYNGMKDLPFKKVFQHKAEKTEIQNNALTYDLAWEGTAIPVDVIRWMCHMDAKNAEYGWEEIGGRYGRTFIGQSTGSLEWKAQTPQPAGYSADRNNARDGKTGYNYYKNAVFATDKNLQSIEYPIKSGYYFNPLGVYTCTVKTAQYKETDASTQEHEELVEKVKGAFRYSSGIQYITASRSVTTLTNVSEDNDRAVLAVTDTKTIKTTKLETTKARSGNVDRLLAEVMEGYAASMSEESSSKYRYQERTDKAIYLVEEETVITFTLAPPGGVNMYTHVNMPNGEYTIRVWSEQFDFVGPDEKKVNLTAQNSGYFDGIKVTVRGSIYDDK